MSRATLEGERKQVTVLFADLQGSTALIRDLDPEAAQRLLDPALWHVMDAVHRYEGTVNQVLGDGIMALFGAPIAHEDHALRACYAALAMQTAMQRYAEEVRRTHGMAVQLRVGLNSGDVVVRTIGNDLHMDYSAVGPTTHLAARMEQLATPGSILLTAATLRLVEGLVRVHALGPVPVKGLTEPVEVFELVAASAIRGRLRAAAARGLTRFVGRDTELDQLCQALEHARAGHGQVVALVGEAGMGKSRLVHEYIHAHQTQGWRVLESAAVSYSKATPYFPVLELLRRYGHVEENDEPRIIYETRLFPEREYTFKHALTHEVAYSGLLLERRRALHAGIVVGLEALTGHHLTEQVEALAHHALRGEVWDKALAYCRKAGEKALAQSATARPWLWPRNSACARSRPTATSAWVHYTPG
jgi:class 3 adenylate cyclase